MISVDHGLTNLLAFLVVHPQTDTLELEAMLLVVFGKVRVVWTV